MIDWFIYDEGCPTSATYSIGCKNSDSTSSYDYNHNIWGYIDPFPQAIKISRSTAKYYGVSDEEWKELVIEYIRTRSHTKDWPTPGTPLRDKFISRPAKNNKKLFPVIRSRLHSTLPCRERETRT